MSKNIGVTPQQEEIPLARMSKRVWLIIGGVLTVIGGLLCLTLVLAIYGFPFLVVGLVIVALSYPTKTITCPACSTEKKIEVGRKTLKCAECGTKTLLHWKAQKSLEG